ncbi:hypothetical protein HOLDEFILI_04146 [Holdemania filiformis DSM 12042]|uniref:Uncharacterized protein n=1 Tax=Holdemania filiformis DSM 12042 TaxID=545696 RepID=B9YE72_9FIRM|nr:hypothetical protein HOLDEFILI_04146 [Holdemania filiformis DSM 12042]
MRLFSALSSFLTKRPEFCLFSLKIAHAPFTKNARCVQNDFL